MPIDYVRMSENAARIFKDAVDSYNPKRLHNDLRIWFKIFLGRFYHRNSINYSDYINIDQKYLLIFIQAGVKVNLPEILFNYLKYTIVKTRDNGSKSRKWVPIRRLVYDIMVESKLVEFLNL
ncbi:unnamed protein product [Vicia faba]|uniref:Uncharacterized protein n=1 Tax=Vicia faba TaxID=3906 RepID=A0AAV0ZS81_VICFA|nr:unnamed protein product [Vicia faba]